MTGRKLRRAQIVTPFGPGAIIDLVGESFVAEDAGRWRGKPQEVPFARLASRLRVNYLRTPRPGEQLPYFRFPQWLFCSNCRRMVLWRSHEEKRNASPRCGRCPEPRKLVPMRFIAVCSNGHMCDVDWRRWAHSRAHRDRSQSQCQTIDLEFVSDGREGSGLQSLIVRCRRCKARRSLEQLTGKSALPQRCPGKQPWQSQNDSRPCDEHLVAMQRGASSVYFPNVVSAIDIPPESDWATQKSPITALRNRSDFKLLVGEPDHPAADALLAVIVGQTGLALAEVKAEIARLQRDVGSAGEETEDEIRPEEWHALCNPADGDDRDGFISRRVDKPAEGPALSPATSELRKLVSDVIAVEKLREVRVLKEFSRHRMEKEIPSNLTEPNEFLPAVEVFGEGFFLRFDETQVSAWESRPAVRKRAATLVERQQQNKLKWLPAAGARYVMLHSFAHLLLRNTAFEAGYSTSALRERLYVTAPGGGVPMSGILIYTAAGDTEGTLGGLVRMAEPERLRRLLFDSVAMAQWCSFDPVCQESNGQGPGGLSLAACHACCLVPETSCEAFNRLLDRRLLTDEDIGFFAPLAKTLDQVPGGGAW
ncbi:DUF1998 domain-containing protein [Amycolatopsis japonica]|uniref:DUF1998 domain-containing protein n=1 Tax=Amycolatopsis japonica TaxID=208439 RepID=UPI0033FB5DA4